MPLSFGIPLGLLIAVIGALLVFATRYKKTGVAVLGVGVLVTALTLFLIVLAVNSPM